MQHPLFSNPLERVTKLFHGEHHEYQIHPHRDWAVLLVVFVVILLGVVLWSIYFFQGVLAGDFFTHSSSELRVTDTVGRSRLDAVLTEFDERQERAALLGEEALLKDPSE